MDWRISLEEGVAECGDAWVAFERPEGRVRVYLVRPKVNDVDERWAAEVAANAQDAIARQVDKAKTAPGSRSPGL
jgi:hypothetical protein